MRFKISYHPDVASLDLPLINRNMQQRIKKAIETRLMNDPVHFGAPLRHTLMGYRKLRVGDYRVIYEIMETEICIYTIGHRKEVYQSSLREWRLA